MATVILIALLIFVGCYLLAISGPAHRWVYRNPYDRTCSVCGRHEVEHRYYDTYDDWEVFSEGDSDKH